MDKKILFLILLGVLIFTGYPLGHVLAQLTSFCGAGTNTPCVGGIGDLVHNIEITAGFIFGAIAVIMFLVAGVLFLTANGAPEKLQTARSAFIWGIAGVVVGIIAFSIIAIVSSFITQTPQTQTQQPQNQQSQTPQCTDHSQKKCVSNQLFWYNSCGVQQDFIQCPNGCSGSTNDCNPQTQTPQCTDHSQKKCVSNQLFWYNSCGVQQEFIPCSNGCSGSTNDCNPQTQTPQAQSR